MIIKIIFYLFSAIALISGVVVVTARNPVHAVLSLVVTFIAVAALWLLLNAELIALNLIIVYVGAVMTLFLFVVMMIPIQPAPTKKLSINYFPYAILLIGSMLGIVMVNIISNFRYFGHFVWQNRGYNNVKIIGQLLYTQYFYAVELSGIILLLAVVAAISLAKHNKVAGKKQQISAQLMVKPQDRIRLVNIPCEDKNASSE